MSQFNLPKYVKGKSFSEASALIAKKFQDRNDPESVETLNELQGRLKQAQEFVKAEQEKLTQPQGPQHQMPDGSMMPGAQHAQQQAQPQGAQQLAGMVPEGMPEQPRDAGNNAYRKGGNIYEEGGLFNQTVDSSGTGYKPSTQGLSGGAEGGLDAVEDAAGPGAGSYVAAAGTAMELGNMAFGPTGVKMDGSTPPPDVPSQGGAAASGAMKGAAAGAPFGPWGVGIGAAIGAGAGLIGQGRMKDDATNASQAYDANIHNQASNSWEAGGQMYKSGGSMLANMYDAGGHSHPHNSTIADADSTLTDMQAAIKRAKELQDRTAVGGALDQKMDQRDSQRDAINNETYDMASTKANIAKQSGYSDYSNPESDSKFNPMEALRYAPAAMNLTQLAQLKKPGTVGLGRLGNQYEEQLVDERGLQNTVQQGTLNMRDALLSSSGGSGSAARANLLGSQLQGQKALSGAYQAAGAENRQENRAGQKFNLGVDQINMQQGNTETNLNLEQQAGYETNRSKLMSQLGDDLGGIGQEELFKRYPELMGLSYGSKGQHLKSKEAKEKAKIAKAAAKLKEKEDKAAAKLAKGN
jgi:hypothetical protein